MGVRLEARPFVELLAFQRKENDGSSRPGMDGAIEKQENHGKKDRPHSTSLKKKNAAEEEEKQRLKKKRTTTEDHSLRCPLGQRGKLRVVRAHLQPEYTKRDPLPREGDRKRVS